MTAWPSTMKVAPIREWPGEMTRRRVRSNFSARWNDTLELLSRELRQIGAKDVDLLVAISPEQFRLDGYPRSTAKAEHPGIILSFDSNVGHLSYPCDAFDRWEDNLRAVALALEALRKVDRYGVTKRGEQYRGFLALEATAAPAGFATADEAYAFLCKVVTDAGFAYDGTPPVELVLRHAKRAAHPDMPDGSADLFQRVTLAEAKLRAEERL